MHAPFRGRVEDIFQAREAIDERTTMDKLIAFSRGKKPVDDDLARHYQNRDIVSYFGIHEQLLALQGC